MNKNKQKLKETLELYLQSASIIELKNKLTPADIDELCNFMFVTLELYKAALSNVLSKVIQSFGEDKE